MTSTAVQKSTPAPGGGVLHFVSRAAAHMAAAAERRRTAEALRGLDCATLRDIGMSRAEIADVVYGACNQRRRSHA